MLPKIQIPKDKSNNLARDINDYDCKNLLKQQYKLQSIRYKQLIHDRYNTKKSYETTTNKNHNEFTLNSDNSFDFTQGANTTKNNNY